MLQRRVVLRCEAAALPPSRASPVLPATSRFPSVFDKRQNAVFLTRVFLDLRGRKVFGFTRRSRFPFAGGASPPSSSPHSPAKRPGHQGASGSHWTLSPSRWWNSGWRVWAGGSQAMSTRPPAQRPPPPCASLSEVRGRQVCVSMSPSPFEQTYGHHGQLRPAADPARTPTAVERRLPGMPHPCPRAGPPHAGS